MSFKIWERNSISNASKGKLFIGTKKNFHNIPVEIERNINHIKFHPIDVGLLDSFVFVSQYFFHKVSKCRIEYSM